MEFSNVKKFWSTGFDALKLWKDWVGLLLLFVVLFELAADLPVVEVEAGDSAGGIELLAHEGGSVSEDLIRVKVNSHREREVLGWKN